jgi:hypothetical protein
MDHSVWWRQVFNEQRGCWEVNFSRIVWPSTKGPTPSTFDDDRSAPARRSAGTPVLA